MGKAFFTGWALWEKMTFVLACGIVLTVIVGLIKLQYDKYRIRKYSKVDKGKQAQTPEMLESQPVQRVESKDEVPFGIRAIESGIEVDGVWISRSNTPVGSSRSSMTDLKLPHSGNNSQLELPNPVHAGSSRNSSRAPSSVFDRAVSAERLQDNSRSSSPGLLNPSNARGRPPVASSSRFSNPNLARNSTTLNALEGLGTESGARHDPNNAQTSLSNSSRNSDESDYMHSYQADRPYEAAYINPRHASQPVSIDPRVDLDLLQSHRMSHVAETGQLTPRVRKPGNAAEYAALENTRSPQEIVSTNGVDYFVPQQKAPSPPAPLASPPDQQYASASTYIQDGHSSNQARQAVPLLETYVPQPYQYLPETYQPSHGQEEYEQEQPQDDSPTQVHRQSQVLRKVNSGFEILRPGTFAPPSPEEGKTEVSEKRQSKKLQKRRRTSASSRSSAFVEQV